MTDITTPIIIETIAKHLRSLAIIVDDLPTVDFLMTTARQLDDRAEELREDDRKTAPPQPDAPSGP
jgi:hypothetical protein